MHLFYEMERAGLPSPSSFPRAVRRRLLRRARTGAWSELEAKLAERTLRLRRRRARMPHSPRLIPKALPRLPAASADRRVSELEAKLDAALVALADEKAAKEATLAAEKAEKDTRSLRLPRRRPPSPRRRPSLRRCAMAVWPLPKAGPRIVRHARRSCAATDRPSSREGGGA